MGGTTSAIGSGLAKIGSGAKSLVSSDVPGTGQSVDDLKGRGYSDGDIKTMVGSTGAGRAKMLGKGLLGGIGKGLPTVDASPAVRTMPTQITAPPPVATPEPVGESEYLANLGRRRGSALYGGM